MIQVEGRFTTPVAPAELRARQARADRLGAVDSLADVSIADDGTIRATFTPRIPLGRIPLRTMITISHLNECASVVTVVGRRGPHSVDVTLQVELSRVGEQTDVAWSGELRLGGAAASVGQRVGSEIARVAIEDVLVQLAQG